MEEIPIVVDPSSEASTEPSQPGVDPAGSLLIQINIYGNATHSSTRMKVTPTLTAGAVCSMVSERNGVPHEDQNFFTLVVVYTNAAERDKPLPNAKPSHLIRTLKSTDVILDIIKNKELRTPATKEAMYTTKWYFKDIRSPPLSFDGDISGDSSSDEEEDVPVNFLSYLRQTGAKGRTGYLLKRSVKDPNLWRKRLCLVADFHMWCIHAYKGKYKAKKIRLSGPVFLQDDLLPLEYPLGFSVKDDDKNYFFRATDEEEQTSWTSELVEVCKNEEDNRQIYMADVLIGLEEHERNKRCSDCISGLLSDHLLSWLGGEMANDNTEGHQRDNEEFKWSIHSFHSYHPLCGKAMGFLVAVKEEYKDLFRKFIRPSSAAFWDCVVQIYKQYVMTQIISRNRGSRKPSLCFPEKQIPGELNIGESIAFYEPSYLSGALEATLELQKILGENVRWKSKEEILAETSLKSNMIQEKKNTARDDIEAPAAVGWFSSWVAPKPVEVDYNSDLDRIMHGADPRSAKSSRHSSKRIYCMSSAPKELPGEIYVSDYILLKGHDSDRPSMELFDDLVMEVTKWLNHQDTKHY